MRPILLLFALLLGACTLAPPRPLASDEGWICDACSRVPRRVLLDDATRLRGATEDRRAACRAHR